MQQDIAVTSLLASFGVNTDLMLPEFLTLCSLKCYCQYVAYWQIRALSFVSIANRNRILQRPQKNLNEDRSVTWLQILGPPARKSFGAPLLPNDIGVSRTCNWWGRRTEAPLMRRRHRDAESLEGGRLGMGNLPSQLGGWESVASSLSGVRGRALAENRFWSVWSHAVYF